MRIFQKIYKVVAGIPKGEVMTYKQVAEIAETTPNVVGFALHANKDPQKIPCHRVIKSNGTLAKGYAFGGLKKQKQILEKEGVVFYRDHP
ncbi:MAG: MGMT family protein [Candidatus Levybacteria bacterium]|nr:MGMT family protein [Candidatus Levybacteria bacterium]